MPVAVLEKQHPQNMTLLQDAASAEPTPRRYRNWLDRLRANKPEVAGEIETLIAEWVAGKQEWRERFRSKSKLAEFIAQPKYGVDVSAQEVSKLISRRGG